MRFLTRILKLAWQPFKRILPDRIRETIAERALGILKGANDRWHRTPIYQSLHSRRVAGLTQQVPGGPARSSEYYAYLQAQINKSVHYSKKSLEPILMERTVHLVNLLNRNLPSERAGWTCLCVGCRNAGELRHIEQVCSLAPTGLDLFSEDPSIKVGDMHDMPFSKGEFDVVYSCHSLEHAFDIDKVIAEFVRVVRPGGYVAVEVPTNFAISEIDRWDVGSANGLIARFPNPVYVLSIEEDEQACRSILRIGENE